jgi:uncharacterized protein
VARRPPPRLVHAPSGAVLASRLLVPRTAFGRGLGLMFRAGLAPGEGMWIAPCSSIHTFFMRFPIDAVFLDRQHRVARVYPGLRPWRMIPWVRRAYGVVELPAGTIAAVPLVPGDPLWISPSTISPPGGRGEPGGG